MTTVAHNVVAKLSVAFVAVAMLFTMVSPAKAATAEEMQQMINQLLAQVASLQGQTGGGSMAAGVCPYTWTRTLKTGSTGADVMKLQQFLNADADTRVSASGVGSAGMETEYFGPATAAAVSKFQVKYRSDVLSPAGLVNPTGTFGPASMAKANSLCVSAPVVDNGGDDTDDDTNDNDNDDDMSSNDLSGEASLDSVETRDGDDNDDVEEGSEDVAVAEIELTFEDGDAIVDRLDLALEVASGNNGDDDPWKVFQDVSLWVDGEEVARKDASDKDEYLDEDDGSLRFSNLDVVAMDGEEVTFVVAVSVNDSVDGVAASDDEDWSVAVGGVRYTDADDVTSTETATGDIIDISNATIVGDSAAVDFSIDVEGAGDELDLESSDDDPEATTLSLDEDDNTEAMVFAFDLSAEDSDGDITLNEITLTATVTNPGTTADDLDDLVNDVRIEIGGDSFDADAYSGATTTSLVFDIDGDATISGDEKTTVMVYVDFENMDDSSYEGSTIVLGVNASAIDAEGADSGEEVTVSGASNVEGDTHTLRTDGVDVEVTDTTETLKANTDTTTTDDEGVFEIEFDVTAFGTDLYIDDTAEQDTSESDYGVNYRIVNSSGSVIASSTAAGVATLDAETDLEGGYFKVDEGETVTFTLTVEFDPAVTGSYRLELYSVNWNDVNSAPADTQQTLSPSTDYDTALLTI